MNPEATEKIAWILRDICERRAGPEAVASSFERDEVGKEEMKCCGRERQSSLHGRAVVRDVRPRIVSLHGREQFR